MADAIGSGPIESNLMQVQLLLTAPIYLKCGWHSAILFRVLKNACHFWEKGRDKRMVKVLAKDKA